MQDFLSTVILLFIVIDPVGLAPMIQGMLKKYSPAQQKAILMRELVFALSLLLLFFFSGKFLLDLLGLEPSTLNISGGILLFLVALGMVFPAKDMLSSAGRTTGQDEPFIVPIAMPLMAGPSSLAIIMLHASQSPDSISQMTYAGAIVTAWFLSGLVLFIAQKFLRLLGEKRDDRPGTDDGHGAHHDFRPDVYEWPRRVRREIGRRADHALAPARQPGLSGGLETRYGSPARRGSGSPRPEPVEVSGMLPQEPGGHGARAVL